MLLGADCLGRSVFGELPELEEDLAVPPSGGGAHGRTQIPPGFHTRKPTKPVHAVAFGAIVTAGTGIRAGRASGTVVTSSDGEVRESPDFNAIVVELVPAADVVAERKTDISSFKRLLEEPAPVVIDTSARDAEDDRFVLDFMV